MYTEFEVPNSRKTFNVFNHLQQLRIISDHHHDWKAGVGPLHLNREIHEQVEMKLKRKGKKKRLNLVTANVCFTFFSVEM
jgi:Zn-finger domain-containing protein